MHLRCNLYNVPTYSTLDMYVPCKRAAVDPCRVERIWRVWSVRYANARTYRELGDGSPLYFLLHASPVSKGIQSPRAEREIFRPSRRSNHTPGRQSSASTSARFPAGCLCVRDPAFVRHLLDHLRPASIGPPIPTIHYIRHGIRISALIYTILQL
jgi:hypothetical protein